MSRARSLSAIMAIAGLAIASPLLGQDRPAVTSAELDAAVATRIAPRGEAIRALLSTTSVQAMARQVGIGSAELSTKVAELDDATLAQLAQQAGFPDQPLAGGANTVVISTTTLIIILLIVIILAD